MSLPGLVLVVAGSACLYLASPNQRMLARPWPRRPACVAGVLLLGSSQWALLQQMQPLAAVFCFVTVLMLALSALPYLGALVSLRRRG